MQVISHDLKTDKLSCYCFNDADVRNEIPRSEIKDSLLLIALIISSSSSPYFYRAMRQRPNYNCIFSRMQNRIKFLSLENPNLL